jgi:hypothetical protein
MISRMNTLIPIHSHPLTLPAQLAIRARADRSAGSLHLRAALLQCEKLLRAEGFVVNLRGRFDEVLEVRAGEEVAQVDEFAVSLVFDIDGAPAVLAAAHGFAIHGYAALGADDGEGDDGLRTLLAEEDVSMA